MLADGRRPRQGRAARADHARRIHDWEGVVGRAPAAASPTLWTAARNDLCFATTNRQAALQAIAARGRRRSW